MSIENHVRQRGGLIFWLYVPCCANIDKLNVSPLDLNQRQEKWKDLPPGA